MVVFLTNVVFLTWWVTILTGWSGGQGGPRFRYYGGGVIMVGVGWFLIRGG